VKAPAPPLSLTRYRSSAIVPSLAFSAQEPSTLAQPTGRRGGVKEDRGWRRAVAGDAKLRPRATGGPLRVEGVPGTQGLQDWACEGGDCVYGCRELAWGVLKPLCRKESGLFDVKYFFP
jgi:hypothetical protein